MRFKVKIENNSYDPRYGQESLGEYKGSLYFDPPGKPLQYIGSNWFATRDEAIAGMRRMRDQYFGRSEPEWLTLDDPVEPQSLKAV